MPSQSVLDSKIKRDALMAQDRAAQKPATQAEMVTYKNQIDSGLNARNQANILGGQVNWQAPQKPMSTPAGSVNNMPQQPKSNPYAGKTGPNGEPVNSVGTYQDARGMNTQYVEPSADAAEETLKKQERQAQLGIINEKLGETKKIGKDFGLDTGPDTIEGLVDQFKQKQVAEKSYLLEQQKRQEALDLAESEKFKASAAGAESATKAQFSQGREGAVGSSAPQIANEFSAEMAKQINQNKIRLESAQASRANLVRQLDEAQRSGQTELADSIGQQLAAAENTIQKTKTDYLNALAKNNEETLKRSQDLVSSGVLDGATSAEIETLAQTYGVDPLILRLTANAASNKSLTDQKKAELDIKVKGIDTLGKIFEQGSKMDISQLSSLASSLGVSFDTAASLYQGFEANRSDKTLSLADQQLKNRGLLEDVKQKEQGIFTQSAQDMEYIKSLYKKGDIASAHLMERKLGIDDLSYQADLSLKNAQINYQKSATAENYQNLLMKKAEYEDIYGSTAVIPKEGKYAIETVSAPDGKQAIKVGVVDGQSLDILGTDRREDWCAAFVNDALGTRIGSENKADLITDRIPTAGMAFVQLTNDQYDHTGIVESVDLVNGKMNVVEANWKKGSDGKGIASRRTMNIADAVGFIKPQNSVQSTGQVNVDTLAAKYIAQGVKDKKAAKEQATKDILAGAGNGDSAAQIAEDIMQPYSTLSVKDLPPDQRAGVERELNLKRKEAYKSNDVVGLARASAGGEVLDATTLAKLEKINEVVGELQELSDVLLDTKTGPILGALRSNIPYDDKAVQIKALIQGLVPSLARGVYGEVGVLTDQDINNYIKTLPNLSSTEAQKKLLLDMTKKTLSRTLEGTIKTQAMGGRDVSGFASLLAPEVETANDTSADDSSYNAHLNKTDYSTNPSFNRY